jgi:hypothetical protein
MMISVYSHYLDPIGVNSEEKPSIIHTQLRNAYNQGVTGILYNTRMFSSANDDEEEIQYEMWHNEAFCRLVMWSNEKIVLPLGELDYRAIGVRTTILSRCMSSLTEKGYMVFLGKYYIGKLTKLQNIIWYQNFITNLRREMSAINTEDLPF